MIVSWNWLKQYVELDMSVDELTHRLTMSGLNLEGVEEVEDDVAIDLEVTSNRPDCLGHIGVAREISVLFDTPLSVPEATIQTVIERASDATSVSIECEDLCPQYIARVIRGIKVGPSPGWLKKRLEAVGIATINNVVDISNYVLMETAQPLHTFDFNKLHGQQIVVRRAKKGEKLVAIDQREYALSPEMCVIADADRPVAIAGVMGGLDTEIGEQTTDVLIEVADFAPLSIRNTARALSLHSDSSYRFERQIDSHQTDWVSRRCCQLILDVAGGELLDGHVLAGNTPVEKSKPISLRFDQIPRLLGIDVPADEARGILESLGLESNGNGSADSSSGKREFIPPSWRRDLVREIDLVEEVARIHGYDEIPDDIAVPLQLSSRSRTDRVSARVSEHLTASGFYEGVTLSFVSEDVHTLFQPHADRKPLFVEHSSRRRENLLRQSLIPSLLVSRRENERQGTFNAELFEIAKVYLEARPGEPESRVEPKRIGMVSGRRFGELLGVVDRLAKSVNRNTTVSVEPSQISQFAAGRGASISLDGQPWGWLGELDRKVTDQLDLRDAVAVAELDFSLLEAAADLAPQFSPLPQYPAIQRDLNFVLEESVTWQQLEDVVRASAGTLLDGISFGGQYRGKQIASDKKSYVVTLSYRSAERTLTHADVESAQNAVLAACQDELGAALR